MTERSVSKRMDMAKSNGVMSSRTTFNNMHETAFRI